MSVRSEPWGRARVVCEDRLGRLAALGLHKNAELEARGPKQLPIRISCRIGRMPSNKDQFRSRNAYFTAIQSTPGAAMRRLDCQLQGPPPPTLELSPHSDELNPSSPRISPPATSEINAILFAVGFAQARRWFGRAELFSIIIPSLVRKIAGSLYRRLDLKSNSGCSQTLPNGGRPIVERSPGASPRSPAPSSEAHRQTSATRRT